MLPVMSRRAFTSAAAAALLTLPTNSAEAARKASARRTSTVASQATAKPVVELRAVDFGVLGNGQVDESAALLRLRDRMRADRSKHYVVQFQPGTYRYTNNRWLFGVGSVTLRAHGATFVCTMASAGDQNTRPLNANSIFQDHGDRHWPDGMRYHTGYLIRTTKPGDRSVRLSALADARNIRPGARVLVHSFDQMWEGFPPNLRYFEWNQVTAVNSSTGTISLASPIRYEHDETLRDGVVNAALRIGKARIMLLDRPNYQLPERIEIEGATFPRNPTQSATDSNGLIVAADTLVMRDCRHNGLVWPSENRVAIYERCVFDEIEVDKICDRVEFLNCTINHKIIAATGVNTMVVRNCEIKNGYIGLSSRRVELTGNTIRTAPNDPWGAIRTYYDIYPVEMIEAVDNRVVTDGMLHFAINPGFSRQLTVTARSANNGIVLADNADTRNWVIQQLTKGSRLMLRGTQTMGRVTRIGWTGSAWVINGDWPVTVAPGQVWEFCHVQAVRERGTQSVGRVTQVVRTMHATQQMVA